MSNLNPLLNAYRDNLADERLRGKVEATRFVKGKIKRITTHFADVMRKPDPSAGMDTQALHGEDVLVFDERDGWSWVQCVEDGYVGYVRSDTVGDATVAATHMVLAPRTFLYSQGDLKSPRTGYLSLGSKVVVTDASTTRGTDYLMLDSGDAVIAHHLIALGDWRDDPVSVAETLLHAPYLWGGKTGFGLDCSALVVLGNRLCGKVVLRDTGMQANTIGEAFTPNEDYSNLQRGDLIFWKGHVGMMADPKNLLHANGHTMNVALEPLADAVERIGYLYDKPTMVRRP